MITFPPDSCGPWRCYIGNVYVGTVNHLPLMVGHEDKETEVYRRYPAWGPEPVGVAYVRATPTDAAGEWRYCPRVGKVPPGGGTPVT